MVQQGRPRTRGECADGPRPCPWASCRHHLLLDVSGKGKIKLNFDTEDPAELPDTCVLDVAERRGQDTLDNVGASMNVTRERARQIEAKAIRKVIASDVAREFAEESGIDFGAALERLGVELEPEPGFLAPPPELFRGPPPPESADEVDDVPPAVGSAPDWLPVFRLSAWVRLQRLRHREQRAAA